MGLKWIDFLGVKPDILTEKKTKFQSTIGIGLSIILIIIGILCLIFFGADLVVKQKPFAYISTYFDPASEISGEDLFFGMQVGLRGGIVIQEIERKLSFSMDYAEADRTIHLSNTNFTN